MSPVNKNIQPKNRPQRSNTQPPAPSHQQPVRRRPEAPASRPLPSNNREFSRKKRPVPSDTQKRPVRSPQQAPSYAYAENGYEAAMRKNFVRYKKQKRFRRKFIAAVSLLVVLTIVITIVIVSKNGCLNKFTAKKPEVNYDLTQAKAAVNTAIEDVNQLTKKLPELITPEPKYTKIHSYKFNSRRFSTQTVFELDEEITSEFVALYDVTRDEVIYSKKYSEKCYPASTTKLLTAVTASKIITDPKTVITIGDEVDMIAWDSSRAYITKGTKLTFEMLMDALLLPSGNDAAYAMAVFCGRTYKNDPKLAKEKALKVFMELCNDCAKKIGATHTHFTAPDGIHDDDHYTSAQDLMIIADYARTIPIVANSCKKAYVDWTPIKGTVPSWENSNKLILKNETGIYSPYADGMKTGYTSEAGSSVVASATIEGHTFIAVVMNGETLYTKYDDCNLLFKKAFELYDLEYLFGEEYIEKGPVEESSDEEESGDASSEDSEDPENKDEDSCEDDDDSENEDEDSYEDDDDSENEDEDSYEDDDDSENEDEDSCEDDDDSEDEDTYEDNEE